MDPERIRKEGKMRLYVDSHDPVVVRITSNQIRSDLIKSNQISSNRSKSVKFIGVEPGLGLVVGRCQPGKE